MKIYLKGYEVIDLHSESSNESETVIFKGKNLTVYISFYWESHGRLVPFKYQGKTNDKINAKDVKIIDRTWDMTIGNNTYPMESWDLYIDGEKMSYDIDAYDADEPGFIYIDAIVGGS